ncbi:MAG: hypothetical protein FJ146_07645 [Deltaproteobacteria bacterium]|nr:hypothetical protein [Deltaproteobacteria bacterium]
MKSKTILFCVATLTLAPLSCKRPGTSSSSALLTTKSQPAVEEVLLTEGSNPEVKNPPNQAAEDLDPSRHTLGDTFPRAEVGSFQKAGSNLTGTPSELQGIWWMDGNPLSDETVSFATVDFGQERPLLPVFGLNAFTFHAGDNADASETKRGNMAFSLARKFSLIYEFQFDGTAAKYESAKIVPTIVMKVGPFAKRLRVSDKILGFTMRRTGPHLYSRDNTVRGEPIDSYLLKRILVPSAADPNILEKTEWWDPYVNQKTPTHLRLTKRG